MEWLLWLYTGNGWFGLWLFVMSAAFLAVLGYAAFAVLFSWWVRVRYRR